MKPCAYRKHSLPHLLWVSSSCLRQRQGGLRVWLPCRGPSFWDEPPRRPWLLAQQRRHDQIPPTTKDTDQTPTPRPGRTGLMRTPPRHIEQRAVGHRRIGLAAHPQQPPRRHRDGQPQPRRPLSIPHAGPLPLPTAAFRDLEALLNPCPQPVPSRFTGLGRQIGHHQPRVLVALVPARQQGARQATRWTRKSGTPAGPRGAGLRHQGLEGLRTPLALGPKRAAGG